MKKALLSFLLLLVNYSSMVYAGDAKFYGVYGRKSDRNPKEDGFSPVNLTNGRRLLMVKVSVK